MKKLSAAIYSFLPKKIQKLWKRTEASDIGNRIAKGAFWSLSGSIVSQGLMLLASIIVARILGKITYGELGMIRSTVNMFAVFAGFGLGLTATKYVAEYKNIDKSKTGRIIGLSSIVAFFTGAIIAVAIILAAPFLAQNTINAPHLLNQLRMGAVILFFSAMNGSQTGVLSGYEAFKTIAKINLTAGLLSFPIQIIFTLVGGLNGSILGLGANFLFLWGLNYVAVRKKSKENKVPINYENAWIEGKILYKFSLPAVLSGLLVSPVIWACNAMLVNQANGYAEMAVWDASNQWRNVMLFIPVALGQIVLPLLSNSKTNKNQFEKILKINIIVNLIISLFMASIVSIFASLILNSYGKGFGDGRLVLITVAFTSILISINNVIGQAIASRGKMWLGFILNAIWSLAVLLMAFYLIKINLGALGIALSLLFAYIIHLINQFIVLFRLKYYTLNTSVKI